MHAALHSRRLHLIAVPGLLLLAALLAVSSALTDSVTFDETSHLTAGFSNLRTGDFRLAPDHPPLGKIWCAWPLLFVDHEWPPRDHEFWQTANTYYLGRLWLFELNDGQRLVLIGRLMMILLLLATCLAIYALARDLCGPPAGLLALVLAALSPTLLAHGRLVTTDLPITLCTATVLLAFGRLMQRVTWLRLIAAAVALAAAAAAKFSWPLVLPAVLALALHAIGRRAPLGAGDDAPAAGPPANARRAAQRRHAAGLVLGCAAFVALVVWGGIWTCYLWRRTVVAPIPGADEATVRALEQADAGVALAWRLALHHPDGTPRRGVAPALLRAAVATGLLPDAYLLGLAQTLASTSERSAYLCGRYSTRGWRSYFPIAFAIKTPLPTLLLVAAGCAALVRRRAPLRAPGLLLGLGTFAAVYGAYAVLGHINIGHRHLLPLYPVLLAVAGAAAAWLAHRAGRWLVAGAVVWLLAANLWIHPHYLAYFNELVGGPSRGHRYLADSNIDWGQDLLRLADYVRRHPGAPVKLAYFGSAVPTHYLPCTALPSFIPFEPAAELTAGLYVASVTQLLGVNDLEIRDEFWVPDVRRAYAELGRIATAPPPPDEPPQRREQREQARTEFAELRAKRLLNGLQKRRPDDRVGYSLFVYRLTDADIEALTRP